MLKRHTKRLIAYLKRVGVNGITSLILSFGLLIILIIDLVQFILFKLRGTDYKTESVVLSNR
jgi:hypothetical protein